MRFRWLSRTARVIQALVIVVTGPLVAAGEEDAAGRAPSTEAPAKSVRPLRGFVPTAVAGQEIDRVQMMGFPVAEAAKFLSDLTGREVRVDPTVAKRGLFLDMKSVTRQEAVDRLVEAFNSVGVVIEEVDAAVVKLASEPGEVSESARRSQSAGPIPTEAEIRQRREKIQAELRRRREARSRGETYVPPAGTEAESGTTGEITTAADLAVQARRQGIVDDLRRRRNARDDALAGPTSPSKQVLPGATLTFNLVDCPLIELATAVKELRGKPMQFSPDLGETRITAQGSRLTSAQAAETLFTAFRAAGIRIVDDPNAIVLIRASE